MPALTAIVKRIDHILVRVDDPEPLFGLLSGLLELPVSWPMQNHGWYASGGVFVGNASLEIARLGRARPRAAGSARLFGIALEPCPLGVCLRELAARGIPHSLPVCFCGERPDGTRGVRWKNVLLGGLTGEAHARLLRASWWAEDSVAGRLLDPVGRMMAFGHWVRLTTSPTERHIVYLCEYGYEVEKGLSARRAVLEEAGGGPLGLVGLAEVVLGATNPERARQRWQNLLAPLLPVERGLWQLHDGPGIRIVPHDEDTMLSLVLRTRDLARAEAWLRERRMLGGMTANQISVDPVTVQGLDIRLMQ